MTTFLLKPLGFSLAAVAMFSFVSPAVAEDSDAELAKKLANPVASLMSFPLQNTWDFGIGVNDATRYTLNFQPVIPVSINEDANLIIRTIMPFINAESPAPGIPDASGMGDITQSFFYSPKAPTSSGWIWAAGPVFLWPTATDDLLGSGKWGVGPTFVVLKQSNGWTVGMLANHIWSYAGDEDRSSVNATYLQPFVSYTTKTKTTFSLNTESAYDWTNEQWNVPINVGVSQLFKVGKIPFQAQIGGRYYAEAPQGGPEWGMRFTLTILLPAN
ncbi:hypothetical protein BH11VER1_BH11VER1_34000 [soil metagenome]